jgi:phytoene desaturase
MKICVIGAGLGGLSVACLLAQKGHTVSVFERNDSAGGKMNQIVSQGFRFDTGPSLLTMPFVLEKLFEQCGEKLSDHIELQPLDPICRYFYPDGTIFNNFESRKATMEEINRIAPLDTKAYSDFLDYAESLYQKTADAFIFNPLFEFRDLKELDLFNFFGIDAFTTVSSRVNSRFQSDYLRKFFKRFTTYNGSSPFLAPATLNVIPHVEINQGGYYVKGGLYKVAEALMKLAKTLGVQFHFNSEVSSIIVDKGKTTGIEFFNGEKIHFDLIVSNSDFTETVTNLLPDYSISLHKKQKAEHIEPSCSGFVVLLGVDRKFDQLTHHNIFFSEDYEHEFHQLFKEKVMPDDPTIYVANTSYSDPDHAPKGASNLFLLINAPYLSNAYSWKEHAKKYGDKVIEILEQKGLRGLSEALIFRRSITPVDFYKKYLSNKGSIYGTSSNSKLSAFMRPRNKSKEVEGLYYVGGSTHPGGGIPLVVQSAFNAIELIDRKE